MWWKKIRNKVKDSTEDFRTGTTGVPLVSFVRAVAWKRNSLSKQQSRLANFSRKHRSAVSTWPDLHFCCEIFSHVERHPSAERQPESLPSLPWWFLGFLICVSSFAPISERFRRIKRTFCPGPDWYLPVYSIRTYLEIRRPSSTASRIWWTQSPKTAQQRWRYVLYGTYPTYICNRYRNII